jgi:hypothetical protein
VQGWSERLPNGITVEALQIPEFTEANRGEWNWQTTPPEKWDRSVLPAGACVFRLHGFNVNCYPRGHYGELFSGPCANQSPISPGSYYNSGCRDVAPGCPSPNWGSSNDGYWWYLNEREGATDLVICAPECKGSFIPLGACFHLNSR